MLKKVRKKSLYRPFIQISGMSFALCIIPTPILEVISVLPITLQEHNYL